MNQASGVADEALIALGRIATPEAIAVLRQALATGSAENRTAAADACLVCAERLLAQGQRAEAIGLLEQVRLAEVPKHVRAAAVHSAILARPSGDLSFFVSQLKSEEPVLFTAALRASRHLQGREVTQALLTAWEQLPAARQALVIGARSTGTMPRCCPWCRRPPLPAPRRCVWRLSRRWRKWAMLPRRGC